MANTARFILASYWNRKQISNSCFSKLCKNDQIRAWNLNDDVFRRLNGLNAGGDIKSLLIATAITNFKRMYPSPNWNKPGSSRDIGCVPVPEKSKSIKRPVSQSSSLISLTNFLKTRCVTRTQPLWSLTMAPACARPVSPVMTPQGLSSLPSLVAQGTRLVKNIHP